jgi:hypothetical protein
MRRLTAVLALLLPLAGCGAEAGRSAEQGPPGRPVRCPGNVPAARALDARTVVGLPERRAAAKARRAGCHMVAVVRDGEHLSIIADVDLRRLQVEVRSGTVTRIVKVG